MRTKKKKKQLSISNLVKVCSDNSIFISVTKKKCRTIKATVFTSIVNGCIVNKLFCFYIQMYQCSLWGEKGVEGVGEGGRLTSKVQVDLVLCI